MNLRPQLPTVGVPSPHFTPYQAAKGMFASKGANIAEGIMGAITGAGKLAQGIGEYYDTNAKLAVSDINNQMKSEIGNYMDGNGGMSPEQLEKWKVRREAIINQARENAGAFTDQQFGYYFSPINATYNYAVAKARNVYDVTLRQSANNANVSTQSDVASAAMLNKAEQQTVNLSIDNLCEAVAQKHEGQLDSKGLFVKQQLEITKVAVPVIQNLLKNGETEEAERQIAILRERRNNSQPSIDELELYQLENACNVQKEGKQAVSYSEDFIRETDISCGNTLNGRYTSELWTAKINEKRAELAKDQTPKGKKKLEIFDETVKRAVIFRKSTEDADMTSAVEQIRNTPGNPLVATETYLATLPESEYKDRLKNLLNQTANKALDNLRKTDYGYNSKQKFLYFRILESMMTGEPISVGDITIQLKADNPSERGRAYKALNLDPKLQKKLEDQINGTREFYTNIWQNIESCYKNQFDRDMSEGEEKAFRKLAFLIFSDLRYMPMDNPSKPSAQDKVRTKEAVERILLPITNTKWVNENLVELVSRFEGNPEQLEAYLIKEVDIKDENGKRHTPQTLILQQVLKLMKVEKELNTFNTYGDVEE